MPILVFDKLVCGYNINVFDEPKIIGDKGDLMVIPMRITASPVRFEMALKSKHPVAFLDWLPPIKVKEEEKRKEAIKEELVKWVMQYADIVFGNYRKHVQHPCNGECMNHLCLQKTSPMLKE